MCAGFAALELKVFATLLIRDYKLEFTNPDKVPNVVYPLGMELDGPLEVKYTPRKSVASEATLSEAPEPVTATEATLSEAPEPVADIEVPASEAPGTSSSE